MKIKRDTLIQHLQRIACNGQVTEVVFTGAFATAALTPDHLLLVVAPAIKTRGVLVKKGEEVGVSELTKLMKSLGVLAGTGNEAVDVEIKLVDNRLVIDEGARGVLSLLTAAPKTIGSNLEAESVAKLLAKGPKADSGGLPLTRALVEGIRSTFALYKASELELTVGPRGGKVRVGNDNSDMAVFESAELTAKTDYSLLFGEAFVDVLSIITNYSEAVLVLGGPKKMVLIDDDGYQYLLSPRSPGADA
ncbi:hypothetical protein LCGC14_0446640 [marine sediment metagenome]|uniref:Uncharacterized protein n=1 Tax=marine sediment metagenome TaxID=412755 RepID=A0A0F9VT21_9ZZZZ